MKRKRVIDEGLLNREISKGVRKFIDAQELMLWLRVRSRDTITRWIQEFGLPARLAGNKYVFSVAEVLAWMEKETEKSRKSK